MNISSNVNDEAIIEIEFLKSIKKIIIIDLINPNGAGLLNAAKVLGGTMCSPLLDPHKTL